MNCLKFLISTSLVLFICGSIHSQENSFSWPDGKKIAISLSFDDARRSHPDLAKDLFRRIGGKATFYVNPPAMLYNIDGWKELVADGHEIGNHTVNHPCTGNFNWSKGKALENYTISTMRQELLEANQQIQAMLGVTPVSFAYTCGNTFVGRGINQKSYVPLIAEMFESGRGWMNEATNDPAFADFAFLQGNDVDGKDFEADILPMIEEGQKDGRWLLLAGHEIGKGGKQTVKISMLEDLMAYIKQHPDDIWLGTVAEVTQYVKDQRRSQANQLKESLSFAASFDQGLDADFAKGDKHIYTLPSYDKPDIMTKGLVAAEVGISSNNGLNGHAIEFKRKGRPSVFYKSLDNIGYSQTDMSGTVSFWMSLNPEEDLAPDYTDPIQITDAGYDDAAIWVDFTNKNPRSFRMGIFGDVTIWNPDKIGPDENPNFLNRLVVAEDRPFTRNQWTHVVMTYDNLNTKNASASLFINGKLQGSTKIDESFSWTYEKSKIFLGLNFVGLLDEISIYSKALSTHEVESLYKLVGGIKTIIKEN